MVGVTTEEEYKAGKLYNSFAHYYAYQGDIYKQDGGTEPWGKQCV